MKEDAVYNPAIADMVSMIGQTGRDVVGGQIINKTLDAMNGMSSSLNYYNPCYGSTTGVSNNADYQFQTSVLNAAYSGRGTFVDTMS